MSSTISPFAGKPVPKALLVDVQKLLLAYFYLRPDPAVPTQRVACGTSGHRGSSLTYCFSERHVLVITQAICDYLERKAIDGPLYLGIDIHALSQPAFETALEVLAARQVKTMIAKGGEFTSTPSGSHATLGHNLRRKNGLADGIVTPAGGLLPPNHYLPVLIDYLFRHRRAWRGTAEIGKTVVSTALIDRLAPRLDLKLVEVAFGFKWFVAGLLYGTLGFGGEESAGASFSRIDGTVWTIDKDGIALALLSTEITAKAGRDPGVLYRELADELGEPFADRVEAPAIATQRGRPAKLAPTQITSSQLAGEKIDAVLDHAPGNGNGAAIGGIKVIAVSGWFAARPSGTEDIYKIYAESFRGKDHLRQIVE
jgi:phosphoglucomutase